MVELLPKVIDGKLVPQDESRTGLFIRQLESKLPEGVHIQVCQRPYRTERVRRSYAILKEHMKTK